jgi:hypothetical protein
MPSTDYTGGYRVNIFLDPSEEKHHTLKTWCLELLSSSRVRYFSEFARAFDGLARLALNEFNKQQNAQLSFSKVVRAREQMVSGMVYFLTMEAVVITTGVHTFVGKVAHLVDSTEAVGHFQKEGNQQSHGFANRWC